MPIGNSLAGHFATDGHRAVPTGPRSRGLLAWASFGAIAAAALAYLLWRGRGNSFFYDEWGWIEFLRDGVHSVMASYNQHLELAPKAAYQVLFHTAGIAHYWEFRVLAAVAHLSCAAAIFAYALRRIGTPAVMVALPVAFFGAGAEFILWGLNFGFTASIALSVVALLAIEHGTHRGTVLACVLLIVALVFSETALLFALGLAVELTWRDRSLRRAWVWAIPGVLYAAWWVAFYEPYLSEHHYGAIPKFIAQLAAGAAGGMFGLGPHPGWLVLAAILAGLILRIVGRRALTPRLVGLAVTLAVYWILVAFGRAQLGDPGASRYVYTGGLLILLIALESFRGVSTNRWSLGAVAVLSVLALVGNLRAFDAGITSWLHTGSRTVDAELGALQLARATAPPAMELDPIWAPQIMAGPYFAAVHALGSTPADSPDEIAHASEQIRIAADGVLVRAGNIVGRPAVIGLTRRRRSAGAARREWRKRAVRGRMPAPRATGIRRHFRSPPPA